MSTPEHRGDDGDENPGWGSRAGLIALVGAVVGVGVGLLGAQLLHPGHPAAVNKQADRTTTATKSSSGGSPKKSSSTPKKSSSTKASPTPSASSSTSPTPSATSSTAARNVSVVVCNAGSRAGLATTIAAKTRAAGWTVSSVGNCADVASSNTVFYPPNYAAQAQQLATDLGIGRISVATTGMTAVGLTLAVLSGG